MSKCGSHVYQHSTFPTTCVCLTSFFISVWNKTLCPSIFRYYAASIAGFLDFFNSSTIDWQLSYIYLYLEIDSHELISIQFYPYLSHVVKKWSKFFIHIRLVLCEQVDFLRKIQIKHVDIQGILRGVVA